MDAISGSCGEGARAACGLCSSPAICLRVTWRARLSEHLGGFNVELIEANAARILDDPAALAAIGSLAGLARLLPERDPHPELYAATLAIVHAFDDASVWPTLFVRWELQLLGELGFGLDLSECAATGTDADLVYVSPRSGRAVSRDAGQPYCDRLLKLPAFLLDDDGTSRAKPTSWRASRSPGTSSSVTCSSRMASPCRRRASGSFRSSLGHPSRLSPDDKLTPWLPDRPVKPSGDKIDAMR